ncbi:DNA processing protein [Mycoplasmopsis bovigenitalium]|uniref:DNA processing protein n=1 Tax=Mycoplasmopsis bovigenitalium TaxID=2112 RepID=A0A449A9N2_9BACT|nr:DNA-processing protein DprA [Mycoplasmopsis bovigenitalium]VEU60985.1 DNA processing protein [Mycoplasmopsis bovigenitalium]
MNDILLYFSYINKGNNYEIFKDLIKKKKVTESQIIQIKKILESANLKYITVFDKEYPEAFKKLKYAPYVIYYRGDLNILNNPLVCMTGDVENMATEKYLDNSFDSMSKQFNLVTSDFTKFDRKIAKMFNLVNKGVIHILASGHKYLAKELENDLDLFISQYPPDVNPKYIRFKERNALISVLADNLVIYGSKNASGIINLANYFVELGKEVFCYPSVDLEDGNNYLLKNGANLITHVADLMNYN